MTLTGLQYAGLWRRFGAFLIDLFLVAMLFVFGLLAVSTITGEPVAWGSRAVTAWMVSGLLLAVIIKVVLQSRYQGTPGMLLMGFRIIDARTGLRMNLGQAERRSAAVLLAILPGLLGLLWIALDRRKQGLHDKLTETLVILEDEALKTLAELERESR